MIGRMLASAIVVVIGLALTAEAEAADFERKRVVGLQTLQTISGHDCFLFLLDGVTHPTGTPSHWFAMSRTQSGAKEVYATLLAAKLSGEQISVRTTSLGCGGYAIADFVWIAP